MVSRCVLGAYVCGAKARICACKHARTHARIVLMRYYGCYGSLLCLIITSQAQVFCFVFSCVLKMLIISEDRQLALCSTNYTLRGPILDPPTLR